ncbi:MAG TPA: DUF1232 domain-containing protein [bacterium]|nr:DUF1232 domain-containing protein [bacterium]HPN42335.1 DUF1232 domain-containing protein [bacterium]
MSDTESGFYIKLRARMLKWLGSKEGKTNQWNRYLIWAPDLFYLLWKLALDTGVHRKDKVKLLAALAYFISPVDFIPEALLGPVAFTDDIALTAWVLNSFVNETDPEMIKKYWAGEEQALHVIQKIIGAADKMVGKGLWTKLKKLVS